MNNVLITIKHVTHGTWGAFEKSITDIHFTRLLLMPIGFTPKLWSIRGQMKLNSTLIPYKGTETE